MQFDISGVCITNEHISCFEKRVSVHESLFIQQTATEHQLIAWHHVGPSEYNKYGLDTQ